ncbi:MAG: T9SS type A sorting domain-containing protein [Hymenobacter sp.]
MDMPVNLALAMHSTASVAPANSTYVVEGISYANATTGGAAAVATGVKSDGTVSTITNATIPALVGTRLAYKAPTNSGIDMNPGNTTPNTAASYGGAGSYGMEVEMDRTAAGLTGTATLQVFALQNSGDGGYVSTDYIPQNTGPLPKNSTFNNDNNNLQGNPDFALVPGTQAATLNLSATGVTLTSRSAQAAAVALSVYPNPAAGTSTVAYQVTDRAANVHIVLTDLLGRTVRTLENGLKAVGPQTAAVDASALAAGTYPCCACRSATTFRPASSPCAKPRCAAGKSPVASATGLFSVWGAAGTSSPPPRAQAKRNGLVIS